mmetsp:Transcript_30694/g.46493  ORF Transcript_30694/g.46493 Transcript_30694/m.46493 type:complete len:81 (+) Transcript_30694:175-417(+)
MAKVATNASRSARLFAHLVGQADAVVASCQSRKRILNHSEDCSRQKLRKMQHSQQNSDDESISDNDSQSPIFFDLTFSNV